jgi:hypothetical protein
MGYPTAPGEIHPDYSIFGYNDLKMNSATTTCRACQTEGTGKFCSNCGQSLVIKKVTLPYLLHEVFHFFTHLDKGIGYTLKHLITSPGTMQRDFLAGDRNRHQKPFSMYFVAASVAALGLYWTNYVILHFYHVGGGSEMVFFNKYLVMMLLIIIPASALLTWIFFYNSEFGFAEIGVMQLYMLSIFFLMVMLIQFLKLIWPALETRYIELPCFLVYTVFTFKNFFLYQSRWKVILKAIACGLIFYLSVINLQDFIVERYMH